MEHVKVVDTPIRTQIQLDMDENNKNVDINKYQDIIESLLYLVTKRPDIMFCVCLCVYF